jgi:hypothetical protein
VTRSSLARVRLRGSKVRRISIVQHRGRRSTGTAKPSHCGANPRVRSAASRSKRPPRPHGGHISSERTSRRCQLAEAEVMGLGVVPRGQDMAIGSGVVDRAEQLLDPGHRAGRRQIGFVPRSIACTVCSRRRTRRDRIVRIRLTKSGASSNSRQKWERPTMRNRRSVVATIVADRGSPSTRLISPKKSPGCSSLPAPTGVRTATAPSMMMKNESPGSPICVTTVPAGTSTILESSATRRSSFSLNPLKRGTRCRCRIRESWEGAAAAPRACSASSGSWKGKRSVCRSNSIRVP